MIVKSATEFRAARAHFARRTRLLGSGVAGAALLALGAVSSAHEMEINLPVSCAAQPVDMAAEPGATPNTGALTPLAAFLLEPTEPKFGGVSGLDVESVGESAVSLVGVTDSGGAIAFAIDVDEAGRATGVECMLFPLSDLDGNPLEGKRRADAEGVVMLAPTPDQDVAFLVSYERDHRVMRHRSPEEPAGPGPAFEDLERLSANQSFEAIALLADGALLVGAETANARIQPHPVWRAQPDPSAPSGFADAGPPAFTLAAEIGFGLTGFATTPQGNLLVLERFWTPRTGSRLKLSLVRGDALATASGLIAGHTVARLDREAGVSVDNFEGIAASRGPAGETIVWMASDNNFNAAQRTLLYQFAFDETAFLADRSD